VVLTRDLPRPSVPTAADAPPATPAACAHLCLALCTAAVWTCLSGANAPPEPLWACAWGAAALPAAWHVYAGRGAEGRVATVLWILCSSLGCALMQGPWRWAWVACAVCSAALLLRGPRTLRLRVTCALLSRSLALVGLLALLYEPLWTRWQVVPGIAQLALPILRLSGAQAAVMGGTVRVAAVPEATTYTPSPQHLALDVALLVLSCLLIQGATWPKLTRAAVALAVWLPLRYCILVLLTAQGIGHSVFWHPVAVTLSLLPAALVCLWPDAVAVTAPAVPQGRVRAGWALAAAGGLLVGAALTFCDPGAPKAGRILIDESHGPWESTRTPMATEDLSPLSSYNYYWLARLLSLRYTATTHTAGALSAAALSGADVLVIKVPTKPLQQSEVESIVGFVRGGGGLLLVGDHTNVFGTSSCLNPLAQRLGMEFRADATYPANGDGLPLWRRRLPSRHPVAAWLPESFLIHTSSTLRAPGARSVMTLHSARAVAADYSRTHGFPGTHAKSTEFAFGPRTVCAARQWGRGRVVAFADSTVWSNFLLFIPGKAELLLAAVQWLNRENRLGVLVPLAAVLGAVLLGLAWARPPHPADARLPATLAAGLLAALLCGAAMRHAYPEPRLPADAPTLCFEGQLSDLFLPIESYQDQDAPAGYRDYQTLYAWALRLGIIPRYEAHLADALASSRAVVLANPTRPIAGRDLESLVDYVRDGGGLLVILGSEQMTVQRRSLRNVGVLLGRFGVSVQVSAVSRPAQVSFGTTGECTVPSPVVVTGGRKLASLANGAAVVCEARLGKGRVVVAGVAAALTTRGLGAPLDRRAPEQTARSALAFHVLRALQPAPGGEGGLR